MPPRPQAKRVRASRPKPRPRPDPAPAGPPNTAPPSPAPTPSPAPGPGPRPTLEAAVQVLNALYVPGALNTALAIAAYLRDRLLGGSEAGFNPQLEAPSLRALAAREDLSFSPSYLSSAIGVFLQHPLLAPQLAAALSFSHHRALLGVPDAEGKNQLAALAVRKQLDAETLRAEVQKYRRRKGLPPIGHPVDDPVLHLLRRLYRGAGELNTALEKCSRPSASDSEARAIYSRLQTRLRKAGELLRVATRRKESL